MSLTFDPRRVPYWPEIAADWLQGRVDSARFVPAIHKQVRVCYASLRRNSSVHSPQASVLLFGEVFDVYQESDGCSWGQNQTDGYVGFVACQDLRGEVYAPDHWVKALRSFVYPAPDFKALARGVLSMNSPVQVVAERGSFAAVRGAGWVFAKHLAAAAKFESDHVTLAEKLVGTPYLWSGRTTIGLDCSGLVQMVLAACGRPAPRDSDMQAEEPGVVVVGGLESIQRGDLVFFSGHVRRDGRRREVAQCHRFYHGRRCRAVAHVAKRARTPDGRSITAIRRLPFYFTS